MHNQSNTGFEHTSDTTTETKSKRPRRRAAHAIIRSTEAGDHTMCGKFLIPADIALDMADRWEVKK